MRTKTEIHEQLCKRLSEVYEAKNTDYGDSFAKVRSEYPDAICIRLSDKLNRVKAIMRNKRSFVVDESLFDTLLDLANYALLECTEMIYEAEYEDENKKEMCKCSGSCRNG